MSVQILVGDYLKDHGIKQSHIADKCGWSRQKTSEILRGRQKMSVDDFTKVCDAIGVPYDFFFGMTNGTTARDSA